MNKTMFGKIVREMGINRRELTEQNKELVSSVERWAIEIDATEERINEEILNSLSNAPSTVGRVSGRGVVRADIEYHGEPFSEH